MSITAPMVETDCTISHNGKAFTSGGSWLCERADNPGHWVGVVYVKGDNLPRAYYL